MALQLERFELGFQTGAFPYEKESINLSLKDNSVFYQNGMVSMQLENIKVRKYPKGNDEMPILYIPKVQGFLELCWHAKKDEFDHYFLLREHYLNKMNNELSDFESTRFEGRVEVEVMEKDVEELISIDAVRKDEKVKLKQLLRQTAYVHYQHSFMQWFTQVPILRNDVLRMFNIKIARTYEQRQEVILESEHLEQEDKKVQFLLEKNNISTYVNYFSLLTYSYQKLIDSFSLHQNLYRHTSHVLCRLSAPQLRALFTNFDSPVSHHENYLPHKHKPFYGIQALVQGIQGHIKFAPYLVCDHTHQPQWKFRTQDQSFLFDRIQVSVFDGEQLLRNDTQQHSQHQQYQDIQLDEQESPNDTLLNATNIFALNNSSIYLKPLQDVKQLKTIIRKSRLRKENPQILKEYHQGNLSIIHRNSQLAQSFIVKKPPTSYVEDYYIQYPFSSFGKFFEASKVTY